MNDEEGGRLLTAEQAASRLGVSTATVRVWARDRGLPTVRLAPQTVRYRANELDAWVDENRTDRSAEPAVDL